MSEKIEILVTSNGSTEAETKKARELADQLNRASIAADLAARTASKIDQAGSSSRRKKAADLAEDTGVYKQQKGSFGTGSEARDFGKQASGLGGLVRIYATFAANIYALTTAFSMLNKAADTSNMSKGLDQLGAASGRNLNGLAKQLAAVSDGAISMKDAMMATASASAGGLSGDQLLRLTTVAKNASQALGRDMPDALNRLTRGITKIEPELLDELGILVKVDMANQNYARSLGKTASSLTDFEKRQAFATEAITQGEKKFKDIQMAANPFAKLSASIQNLSQSGLELLNKVLIPIADVLASNPIALSASILGLSSVLFKQAIPDVKAWRDSLKEAELSAAKTAIDASSKAQALRDLNTGKAKEILNQQIADKKKETDEYIKAEKQKIAESIKQGSPRGKVLQQALNTDDEKAAKLLDLSIGSRKSAIDKAEKEIATIEDKALIASKTKSIEVNKQKLAALESAFNTREALAQGVLDREAAISNLEVERDKATERRKVSILSQASADRAALKAKDRLESIKTLEVVSEVSKSEGFMAAMSQTKAGITASSMSTIAKATTVVKAGFIATADAAKGLWASIAPWLPLLILGFEALSYAVDKLSGNTKELDKLSKSLESVESSVKGAAATAKLLSEKELTIGLSVEDIKAKSNALNELSTATSNLLEDVEKSDKAATSFGKFMDGFKTVWGGDIRTKATKGLADSLATSVTVADGKVKTTLQQSLFSLLNTTDLTADGITKALDKIEPEKIEEFKTKLRELTIAQSEAKDSSNRQANALMNVKDSLSTASKAADSLITSLAPTDTFSKYAISVVQSAQSISKALESNFDAYQLFNELTSSPSNLATMSEKAALKLLEQKKAMDALASTLKDLRNIEDQRNKAIQSNKDIESKGVRDRDTSDNIAARAKNDQIIKETEGVSALILNKDKAQQKLSADYLKDAVKDSMEFGAKLLDISMKQSFRESALILSKAAAAGLEGQGTADVMYKLRVEEINIQKAQIQQELEVLLAQSAVKDKMEQLALAIQENTLTVKKVGLEAIVASGGTGAASAKKSLEAISKTEEENLNKSIKRATELSNVINKIKDQKLPSDKTVAALKVEAKKASERGDLELASSLQAKYMEMEVVASKVRMKNAEISGAEITRNLAVLKENADQEQKVLETKKAQVDAAMALNKSARDSSPIFSQSLRDEENSLADKKKSLEFNQELVKQLEIIDELEFRRSQGIDVTIQLKNAEIAMADKLAQKQKESQIESLARSKSQIEEDLKFFSIKSAQLAQLASLEQDLARNRIDLAQAELTAMTQLGTISAEAAVEKTYQLSLQTIELEKQKALQAASDEFVKSYTSTAKSYMSTNEANAKKGTPTSEADMEAQAADLERIASLQGKIVKGIEDKASKDSTAAKIVKSTTLELEKQNKVLKLMDSIGNSLAKVFGKVGQSFGSIGKTIITATSELDKLRAQQIDKTKLTAEQEQKYALKTAEVKLGAAAEVTGAVADSLDEQSKAAQVLHSIEKGLHVAKLVMMGVEMAMDATKTAEEIASSEARAVVKGQESIINAMRSLPPPFSFIAGAAMAAVVASIIGKNLGGGSSGSFTPSSDQLKETQGTGFTWGADGKKVSTGYGVLGDDSAKSESIKKSLEFIQKYTFNELEYSNKMLTALQNIEIGINGFSTGIATTKGLLGGTGFGTFEGYASSKWGNVLGSIFGGKTTTAITGSGIKVSGLLSELVSGTTGAKQYETGTVTTKGGWFSSDKTATFTKEQAVASDAFNKAIQDSFTGISNTIQAAGVAIGLDSKQLAESVAQIPIDLAIETRGLKGSEISDAVSAVLSSTADMIASKVLAIVKPFQALGEGLAETAVRVARTSQVIDLQLKSVGMVFKTIGINSLEARMNLVDLAGGLEQFVSDSNFFKDNFLSEAERLAPVQKAVVEEMTRLGYAGVTTREAFKDLVLSLDLSDSNGAKLYNSLMKVQQGFATVYKETENTAKKLSAIKLDQEAKAMELVSTKSQLLAYTRKKELDAMDSSVKPMQLWIYALEDEANARIDLKNAYDKESEARSKAIDDLKTSIKTLEDFSKTLTFGADSPLTPQAKYAQASTDYNAIKNVLLSTTSSSEDKAKALENLPGTISTFLDTSKVFYASSEQYQKDYADAQALLAMKIADSKAQLTIEEKSYEQLKSQAEKLGIINESVLSVTAAIDKLNLAVATSVYTGNAAGQVMSGGQAGPSTQAGSTYMGSSKFDYMESIVKGWYSNHPYASKTPDADGLKYWADEVMSGKSVQDVKQAFSTAVSYVSGKVPVIAIDAFAKGGYADGLAVVGEQGAELVNFKNPGQVYSNGQSNNIMDQFTKEMSAELKSLREEVVKLREAANLNAIFIAQSNDKSSNAAANTIAVAYKEASEVDSWNKNRNVEKTL